ncbi:MAG TPA: hypothetical protein VE422_48590 [Terriglobia bacterium]|nr:hypothetical protein [Terriglobia bacterium]
MIYLFKVYALVAISVFSATGAVYVALAAILTVMPAFQRVRAGRL